MPSVPGAYALIIRLDAPARLAIRRLGHPVLAPGWYVYAGSAYGPGGMRARVGRHLKRRKPIRWHVDHLTTVASTVDAKTFAGGDECAIIAALSRHRGTCFPVPGFGSSDCDRCRAHLIALPDGPVPDRLLGLLDPLSENLTRLNHD